MRLKFFGTGGAFDAEPNSSAYTTFGKNNSGLIIIDCGESAVAEIIKHLKEHKNYKNIVVLITHNHSDHIGGLPTLYYYITLIYKCNLFINHPEGTENYLSLCGVDLSKCETNELKSYSNNERVYYIYDDIVIIPLATKHVPDMICYGFLLCWLDSVSHINNRIQFDGVNSVTYFSGDSCDIPRALSGSSYSVSVGSISNSHYMDAINISLSDVNYWYQDLYMGDVQDDTNFVHMTKRKLRNLFNWKEFKGQMYHYHNRLSSVDNMNYRSDGDRSEEWIKYLDDGDGNKEELGSYPSAN